MQRGYDTRDIQAQRPVITGRQIKNPKPEAATKKEAEK